METDYKNISAESAKCMVEGAIRTIEAERVRKRMRPSSICKKAKINGGCYNRMLRERGGRLSSFAAILDALDLKMNVLPKAEAQNTCYNTGKWLPAILRGNVQGQKCSVCGIVHPVVNGAHPMHYCPSCGSYNGQMCIDETPTNE